MTVDEFLTGRRAAWAERQARRGERGAADPRLEPALPSIPRLALNAAQAAAAIATARVADPGAPVMAPVEVLAARLRVCREAEGLAVDQVREGHCDRYRSSDDRCSVISCGCHLERAPGGLPGRAAYAALDCPLQRWPTPGGPDP